MTAKASFGAMSHLGQVRTKNDDAWYAAPDDGVDAVLQASRGILYAVADGVGGEKGGDRASLTALRTLSRTVYGSHAAEPEVLLREGIVAANRQVRAEAEQDPTLRGMATTLTAVLVRGDVAYLAHVGDSRAYRLRGRELKQLSRDHKRVTELVDSGALTPQEAADHPDAHVITRAIGYKEAVDVDIERVSLRRGDRLLLCSDGLYDMVGDGRIRDALTAAREPRHAAEALIQLANDAGGEDNVTVIVADTLEPRIGIPPILSRRIALATLAGSGAILVATISLLIAPRLLSIGGSGAQDTTTAMPAILARSITPTPTSTQTPTPSLTPTTTGTPTRTGTPTETATPSSAAPAGTTTKLSDVVVRFYAKDNRTTIGRGDTFTSVIWNTDSGKPTDVQLERLGRPIKPVRQSGSEVACFYDANEPKMEFRLRYRKPNGEQVTLAVDIVREN